MIDRALGFIAPHYCCGCGKVGSLLCDNCKYNIVSEPYERCIVCGMSTTGSRGVCTRHLLPYERAWCVGERTDELQRLIGDFKFSRAKNAYKTLAELLNETLPRLPENTVIVPIPTVRSHVRERGFDHMLLIARQLGKYRQLPVQTILRRRTNTKQRDASRSQRIQQAKVAFECEPGVTDAKIYLLIDDVTTTGATLKYAAKTLRTAGAQQVWVATVSRQPSLDASSTPDL